MLRTGSQYVDALRNRRAEIYIGGERVGDVTTHPAFRNAVRTVARLYDTTADPANADALTFVDPDDRERYSNAFLRPRSREDLIARCRVHEAWANVTWGLFGRSPDHVAGWITGMACDPAAVDRYRQGFAANVSKYYQYVRHNDLFVTYAIIPPADVKSADAMLTSRAVSAPNARWGSTAGLQVVGENDKGITVSGFKILATGAILADEILFGNFQPLAEGQERFGATFALPVGTPGLTLLSRRSFEKLALSELDDPLAYRYDETDSVVFCHNVLVPWERVFTYNHVDTARAAFNDTPAHTLGNAQAHIRLLAKLRLILGVAKRVADVNGILNIPAVRDVLSDLATHVAMVEGLIEAERAKPDSWPNGFVSQDRQAMYATMAWTTRNYPYFVHAVRELLGSHPFQQPADASVFDNQVTADIYSRFTLADSTEAVERYKLMRLAWDLVGSEFASRHTQYEMFYNGAQHVARGRVWHLFRWDVVDREVERALASLGGYRELVAERPRSSG